MDIYGYKYYDTCSRFVNIRV